MHVPPEFPVIGMSLNQFSCRNLSWKVRLPSGTPAIVKALKPIEDIADELPGADDLAWRKGRVQFVCLAEKTT
jgi:streptomycin 6-kinase